MPNIETYTYSHADSVILNIKHTENNLYDIDINRAQKDLKNHTITSCSTDTTSATIQQADTPIVHQQRHMSAFENNSGGLITIILLAVAIVGIIRVRFTAVITSLIATTISEHQLRAIINTFSTQNAWPLKVIQILYFITTSTFIYEISTAFNIFPNTKITPSIYYIIILGCVFTYHCFKYIINKIIGYTFEAGETTNYILQCKIVACDLACILLLPIITIFPFVSCSAYNALLIISLIIIGYIYLWRIAKALKIILADYVSAFYSILYLCIVEAIPMICLYKIASQIV